MKKAGILLLAVVMSFTAQASADITGAAWSESIYRDYFVDTNSFGSPALRAPHGNIAPAGSWPHNGANQQQVYRSMTYFNTPYIVRNDNPGMMVQAATLNMPLQYGWAAWNQMVMPGVDAYHVALTDGNGSLASLIQAADFDSAILHNLGEIVPGDSGAGTGGAPGGIYSVDVTAALNAAIFETGAFFPVRLQIETDGKPYDGTVNIDYVFNHAAHGGHPLGAPYLEYTLIQIPEPATLLLLTAGTAALIRRKRNS